jgi:hypothetical protein
MTGWLIDIPRAHVPEVVSRTHRTMITPIYTSENCRVAYQLNCLAHIEGMKPVYQYGYYVGTFGEYDLDAVRRRLTS